MSRPHPGKTLRDLRLRRKTGDLPAASTVCVEPLESRLLLSGLSVAEALASISTTASQAPIYRPGESVEVSPDLTQSYPLINLDDFNLDARFSGYDGTGYSVAVLDTGIDVDHPWFGADADGNGVADRIVYQYDFADGDADASDYDDHGSNVASVIGSEDENYKGVAPGINIIALKVFTDAGAGNFSYIESALQWVANNADAYNILAVNMSLSDNLNHATAQTLYGIDDELSALAAMNVTVVSSSGNLFNTFDSAVGVAYPSADPNSLSIGAVFDQDLNFRYYGNDNGAQTTDALPKNICPFSQRSGDLTTVFAPGALVRGASSNGGMSTMSGTSQAAPFVTGVVALMQQMALDRVGRQLSLFEVEHLLQSSGEVINDGDDESDNVTNTGLDFALLDAQQTAQTLWAKYRALRYDFGMSTSEVAEGYTRVHANSSYSVSQNWGWLSGSRGNQDGGAGSALMRDWIYTTDSTFTVDLPNDTYQVKLYFNTPIYTRDNMGVYLEGELVDRVWSWAGSSTVRQYEVEIADGALTLRLKDLGGNAHAVLSAMEIVPGGPQVVSSTPDGNAFGATDTITLDFDREIIESSLTVDDVVSFTGPGGGNITPTAVTKIDADTYTISFSSQSVQGDYQLVLGPEIYDTNYRKMNQDGDWSTGEATEDRYTVSWSIVPRAVHYDFGTEESPVASGMQVVTDETDYTSWRGFGFTSGTLIARDRLSGDNQMRDFVASGDATFVVDLDDGPYNVTVKMTDAGGFFHDDMAIYLEGQLKETLTLVPGQSASRTYTTTVSDGQLTLRLLDAGGVDPYVVLSGLTIAADAPHIVSVTPDGDIEREVDTLTVTFSEAIQEATFTTGDILSLTGPDGDITPTSVDRVSATVYTITIPRQEKVGSYSLTLSSGILDADGFRIDQDQDGFMGESGDDDYVHTFDLVDPPSFFKFDFQAAGAPTNLGYTAVTDSTTYDDQIGYGWTDGTVYARDRGIGNNLERDFLFAYDATFELDVTDGVYEVKVYMGDTAGMHTMMAVDLEGGLAGTVNAWSGVVTRTWTATVSDGKLTMRFYDGGSGTPVCVVNGVEVRQVGYNFDFGSSSSRLAAGYERVGNNDTYNATDGFGWTSGTVNSADRGLGGDVNRDFCYTPDATFAVDLDNGTYEVTLVMGDRSSAHDQMGVYLEGAHAGTVTSSANQFSTVTYTVTVSDGQLTLRLADLGGSDGSVVINSLQIVAA